jgi:hypothetical protein
LRKYPSKACITKSITISVTTMLQPGYSITPAKTMGIPPMKIPNIGTKLEKKVMHQSASK